MTSFEVTSGIEIIYCNAKAADVPDIAAKLGKDPIPGTHGLRSYQRVTPDGVRDALWLVQYGFDDSAEKGRPLAIDGAYRRSIMISELCSWPKIFAVKPEPDGWASAPPTNRLELVDFNIEMWFNASYAAELAGVRLINDLRDNGLLNEAGQSRFALDIEVVPITLRRPLGIFNFMRERIGIFDHARKQAQSALP